MDASIERTMPKYTALRRTFQQTHTPRRARSFALLGFEWAERRSYEALVMRDTCLCQANGEPDEAEPAKLFH